MELAPNTTVEAPAVNVPVLVQLPLTVIVEPLALTVPVDVIFNAPVVNAQLAAVVSKTEVALVVP